MGNTGKNNNGRFVNIIKAINSPLGFFVLALLIVEGFLAFVLNNSVLVASQKFNGMLIGVGLFILVVVGVWLLVWFKPENLTFSGFDHLKKRRMFGTSDNPKTKEEVTLEQPVKQ